jgi:hypothetical protein
VVRTTHSRTLLAGLGAGALAAGALTMILTGSPASAQATTSTAYGVSASGVESKAAQPSVSSDGAVKTASGSVSGMGWSATGITVKAGAGVAEATVGNVTAGGKSIGSVTAKCADGVTTYSHGGAAPNDPKLKVSFGGGAGATIQILGAGDKPVQTITVAVVKCGKGTPPTTNPPTSNPPTGNPTQQPTGTQKPTGTQQPTGTQKPGEKPVKPAPQPEIKDGHHPVTG